MIGTRLEFLQHRNVTGMVAAELARQRHYCSLSRKNEFEIAEGIVAAGEIEDACRDQEPDDRFFQQQMEWSERKECWADHVTLFFTLPRQRFATLLKESAKLS